MKRRAAKVVLFLLLGAIVNVAVAWGCALLVDSNSGAYRNGLSRVAGLHWAIERHDSLGKARCVSHVWFGFASRYSHGCTAEELIPSWGRISRPSSRKPEFWTDLNTGDVSELVSARFMTMLDEASGWPMRSLWLGWGTPELQDQPFVNHMDRVVWGITVTPPAPFGDGGKGLPLHPIWPGFAINTVLYAAVIWLLFAAPFALRRWRRIKRGRCPACAYPIGNSPICTECGQCLRVSS